jgi:hypothetical protein
VGHFLQHRDLVFRLYDLEVAVIAGAGSRCAERNTALAKREIFGSCRTPTARPATIA